MYVDNLYLDKWKEKVTNILRVKYNGKLSDKKINKILDELIESKMNNKSIILINNYTNKIAKLPIIDLANLVYSKSVIATGGGCLFMQHSKKKNVLIEFILSIMEKRKYAKAQRKKYPKGSAEWLYWDITQLNAKLLINSLYGCLGYAGFIMFNIFIAEAITNQGRHIITSAINNVENFVGSTCYFNNSNDMFNVISNILEEAQELDLDGTSIDALTEGIDIMELPALVYERYLSMCKFDVNDTLKGKLIQIMSNASLEELILLYYKNNIDEFNKLPYIKNEIKTLIDYNGSLLFCEDSSYKDDTSRGIMNLLWDNYKTFVEYNYPVYDRVQKAMYYDKKASLYTDTDSVFISLYKFVKYIMNDIYHNDSKLNDRDLRFTSANVMLTMVNKAIDRCMKTLCSSTNIADEWAAKLNMKNEFYFSRIVFTDVKKRYVSLALLQEGQILNDGKGLPEIKGFDFKKANTKKYIKNYYTNLILDKILYTDDISVIDIFNSVMELRELMTKEINNGNMEFFRQSNVKRPEYYKNPYSTSGVIAISLWNILYPEKALEFPVDVNLVPIKSLNYPKGKPGININSASTNKKPTDNPNVQWYKDHYPDKYELLLKSIYSSPNSDVRHMSLSFIAIPKNIDYEIPPFIRDLIDLDSIVNNNIKLIIPILNTLGLKSFKVNAQEEYISNVINI